MSSQVEALWKEVTDCVAVDVSREWWSTILTKYSEEARSYHNLSHLQEKIEHFESVRSVLKHPPAVALAIFFHYLDFDPKSADCGENNVEHFLRFAKDGGLPEECLLHKDVLGLLKASTTNSTEEHKTHGVYGTSDLHYFLDIDMAILGSSPEDYHQYTLKDQQEYSFLPDNLYKSLRLKVLQNFLQIPNIFATKEFRDKLENQARLNIQKEVEILKS